MRLNRRHLLAAAAALCSLSTDAATAAAPAWPTKPLHIVVSYPPGGSSDIIASAISQVLSESPKQSVIVENKPGAKWQYLPYKGGVQAIQDTMAPSEQDRMFEAEHARWAALLKEAYVRAD